MSRAARTGPRRFAKTILSGAIKPHGPFAEALMFSAARIDHIDSRIRPALAQAASWVICDRFLDSTRVYQGVLRRDRRGSAGGAGSA